MQESPWTETDMTQGFAPPSPILEPVLNMPFCDHPPVDDIDLTSANTYKPFVNEYMCHIYIYTYIYVYTCIYAYSYMYIYMYTYIYIYVCTHLYMHTFMCVYIYTGMCIYIHIHMYIYI